MNFAQPAWLVLLVLLPLLGVTALMVARLRSRQWAAFVAPRLRHALLKHSSPLPRWFALWLLLAACAAILAALARPQGDDGTRTEKSLGRNLLIALDLSRSMRVTDVTPDRLARAKMVIYELLDAMPNERVGLIGFAGAAYVYAPLTVDHGAVRETVEQIDETWAPAGGSNLAAAVQLATDTLQKTGQKNNALVILSDGEKHEGNLDAMVAEAKRSGVFILAVGVGTEDGDYVPNAEFPGNRMVDRSGKPIISRLQPEVLRNLARETHGRFAVAGSGVDIPAMVKSAVKDLDAFEVEGRERRSFIEFYQWLLLPAIVFLFGSILAATRWRAVTAATRTTTPATSAATFTAFATFAGALLLLGAPRARAADAVADAKDAFEQKNYPQARDAYRDLAERSRWRARTARFRLGEGTAAYRAHDFDHARSAFSAALQSGDPAVLATAHTGLGNALFQLGWHQLADSSYPDPPAPSPDLAEFDAMVKARLAQLQDETPAQGEVAGYDRIAQLITNWTDALRHFDSARAADPATAAAAANNRGTVMTYLQRLAELLDEDQQQTRDSMPEPGDGPPQPGEGDPNDPDKEGQEGDPKGPKPPGDQGQGDEEDPNEGNQGDQDPPEETPGEKPGDQDPSEEQPAKPGETPEDRARRILKENADLEKGPLTPGRREFLSPKQDW